MTTHRLIRIACAFSCVAGTMMSAACDEAHPPAVGPSIPFGPAVTSVAPAFGRSGEAARIHGAGFSAGATVTIGGASARILSSNNSSTIDVIVPDHDGGLADVVVTNPGGRSLTLIGGFRFTTVTISVSADVVNAGGELTVSWIVPDQGESPLVRGAEDSLSLWHFNTSKFVWFEDTTGIPSGARTLAAPTEPGQYEFQYRDFNELRKPYARIMGRSSSVTVTAEAEAGSQARRR
jgi:hypothetical protein